jgi:tRNA(fMet)-specific endonuclease VapC
MNRALIDTDILSYYFKGDKNVVPFFNTYLDKFGFIEISIITYYEILSGLNFKRAVNHLQMFEKFVKENSIVPLSQQSCKISSDIYSDLRNKGILIDSMDLLIAGIAIENQMTLITNNDKHFERISYLSIENWKTI